MTAPDARDELREALARAFADGVAMRRQMEPLTDRQWAIARAAWEDDIAPLLPVVTAWAEKQARARAAEELFVLASRLVSQDVGDLRVYDEIRALRDDLAGDPA